MIGERLSVQANFNSRAQFDFENQIRFDYVPEDDAILRRFEVGNVNMALNTQLIQGSESLFGIKAQLQFGRLRVTGLLSQQRSRTREITLSNGAMENESQIDLSDYEDNQHYFLAHYFRDRYNEALALAPVINSQINITQVELWVSNRANRYEDARDVVGLLDLGEFTPHNTLIGAGTSRLPSTGLPGATVPPISNTLLDQLGEQGRATDGTFLSSFFAGSGAQDNYVRLTYARQLIEGQDYVVNRRLGYISLRFPLHQDQALTAAYRYLANGIEYQVGEFSTDLPANTSTPQTLYTKLLKNETLKTDLPIWDLMMKNIYALGARNVSPDNFFAQIYRTENETNAERPTMHEGQHLANRMWLDIAGLDRITQQQARGSDGMFDYIEGYTIQPQEGKIIFPVLEPFGADLASQFATGEQELIDKYVYSELYSHTKVDAQQLFPLKNRYALHGRFSSALGSEFSVGVMNIRPESIRIMAGGMLLEPTTDYIINEQMGTIRILNEALLLSGQPIIASVEDDAMFGIQQRSLVGGRLDYTVNPNIHLGATVMKLTEKPLTEKVLIGTEPVSNTVIGADFSYNSTSRWLTRLVDKLPFLSTKEESFISFYGEVAKLIPGHPRGLDTDIHNTGVTYIDDFENTVTFIDLKPQYGWQISGTPRQFSESDLNNNLRYGYNRALISFYNIDPIFYKTTSPLHPSLTPAQLSDHRVREVTVQELFPNRDTRTGQDSYLPTFDLSFYPHLRGPYNYTTTGVNSDGTLINPKNRWGGLFRKIDQTDFEAQNIEFLEMWMMDPALTNPGKEGGDIYFNLGNMSEDILKDGRRAMENGIPPNNEINQLDMTNWGYVIRNQPVIQAFDNNPDNRLRQDVGLDGMGDAEESSFHAPFLSQMQGILSPAALAELREDPSSDNYSYFIGNQYEQGVGILDRYKHFRGLEGNSRTNEQSLADFGVETSANTLLPDAEDVNRDNTMNEVDEYYQYRISTRPEDMVVGRNHIVDEFEAEVTLATGVVSTTKWYKIRIPLSEYESTHGNVQNFKTIRFIRTFMTDFADTTVIRLARFQFVRGEWRRYNAENSPAKVITDPALGVVGTDNSTLHIANINVEENGNRSPIPYVVPPGINRQVDYQHNNLNVRLNEQALSLEVTNLRDGYGRAAFRTLPNDLRGYGRLQMFIHAEGENLRNGDVRGFIRLGTDDRHNYYEYDIPLSVTPYGTVSPEHIWPESNRMNIQLRLLQDAKLARDNTSLNGQPWPLDVPFEYTDGDAIIRVMGTPDMSKVRHYMLGVRNPLRGSASSSPLDDGRELSGEFWFNELRLSDFDDRGGWAATARMDIKLADFANIAVSGTKSSIGWGSINQRFAERNRSEDLFVDVTSSVELGRFFHPRHGVIIPFFFNLSRQRSTPEYNPLNPDIELNRSLATLSAAQQDSLRRRVEFFTHRSSFSFNNVRKIRTNNEKPIRPWDVENFSLSYAFSNYAHRDFNTLHSTQKTYRGAVDYTFSTPDKKEIEPFKFVKSDYLRLIRDVNFNVLPSLINFRMDVNRIYHENTFRDNSSDNPLPTLYNKNFNMNRIYGISWDLTRSLRLDFNATNYAIIDEPLGPLDVAARDTMWRNFWRMGRTTDYNQMMNVTYTFPINKIPYLEWVNIIGRYGTQFNWHSEPLLAMQSPDINIGNHIQNNRTIQLNPSLSLPALYNKFGFIRRNTGRNAKGGLATLIQFLTAVRKVDGSFLRTEGMFLPGYLPRTNALGYDFNANAPGWGFVFGSQSDILTKAAMNGWITGDTLQTQLFTKTFAENISTLIGLEPIRGLRIDLTAMRVDNYNRSTDMQINPEDGSLQTATPFTTGNYSISQVALRAAFKDPTLLFQEFEANKLVVSQRLAEHNINSVGQDAEQFGDGYGKTQQDVVLNAFLATYLGKDIDRFALNRRPSFPLPNWRINYNGLTNIPVIKEIFSLININHVYQSEYLIAGYNSMIRYRENEGMPIERDLNDDFLPKYQYQQVSLLERFVPLIGIDARLQNNFSATSEYRRIKSVLYSMLNNQLSMLNEESIILGLGYRKQNVRLPFGIFQEKRWQNDVNFRCDMAINDRKTTVYRTDSDMIEVSAGNKSITFNPTLDYIINNRYNVRIFYNSNMVRPYTSQMFATTYTYFGFNLRILFN